MIRDLTLTGMVAAAGITGLATTPAMADTTVADHRHDRDRNDRDRRRVRYEVQVRHGWHWDTVREFRDRGDAERLARRLKWQGHRVRIERGFGR